MVNIDVYGVIAALLCRCVLRANSIFVTDIVKYFMYVMFLVLGSIIFRYSMSSFPVKTLHARYSYAGAASDKNRNLRKHEGNIRRANVGLVACWEIIQGIYIIYNFTINNSEW